MVMATYVRSLHTDPLSMYLQNICIYISLASRSTLHATRHGRDEIKHGCSSGLDDEVKGSPFKMFLRKNVPRARIIVAWRNLNPTKLFYFLEPGT